MGFLSNISIERPFVEMLYVASLSCRLSAWLACISRKDWGLRIILEYVVSICLKCVLSDMGTCRWPGIVTLQLVW